MPFMPRALFKEMHTLPRAWPDKELRMAGKGNIVFDCDDVLLEPVGEPTVACW
jgi:hypothetical protein